MIAVVVHIQHTVYTSQSRIKLWDIGIVEKARKQDWTLWANCCVHVLLNAFMNNEWYQHTCCEIQEILTHYILCSQYLHTHANNLISVSFSFQSHHRSCSALFIYMCSVNLILLDTTLTWKVIGTYATNKLTVMPWPRCDKVTVIYIDCMNTKHYSWITILGITNMDGYRDQIASMSVWLLATDYVMCLHFTTYIGTIHCYSTPSSDVILSVYYNVWPKSILGMG